MALSRHALTTVNMAASNLADTPLETIEFLVNAASDAIRRYCGRDFAQQTTTEHVPGYGTPRLMLKLTPIREIQEILVSGAVAPLGSYMVEDADAGFVRVKGGVWPWTAVTRSGPLAMRAGASEYAGIAVTYTGGFVTPAQAEANPELERNLPYELEQACLQLISAWHHERQRDPGVVSEKLGSLGITYGIPTWMHPLLAPWKRVV